MAVDISGFNDGNVGNEGKVNWRGDQATVPPGSQSILDSSSVKLADLGTRKVVGDRVFRYAQAAGTIGAGEVCEFGAQSVINVTAGGTDPAGAKTFTWYSATSVAANHWAEGYVCAQSGTASNQGLMYRIKSHSAIATTTTGTLFLYEPLKKLLNVADKYSIFQNPYKGLTQCTAGTNSVIGVTPIAVTSSDYFWIQTYGPQTVKCAAVAAAGRPVVAGATGQVSAMVTTDASVAFVVGQSMQVCTASERGLVFITLAP